MRVYIFLFLVIISGLLSCNNEGKENPANDSSTITATNSLPPASSLDDNGTARLVALVNDYYELKDALVATNAARADAAAQQLQTAADTAVAYLKTDSVHYPTMQLYFDTLTMSNKKIMSVKDETCEVKRLHFEKVSDAMYAIVKQAGLKNAGVYRQYCPMAFNDKGAYWLSNEMEIKNPYFGKKMLECGEVTDSLK